MHLNQDYKLRKIAGQYYLIRVARRAGGEQVIQLAETAAWIISAVEDGVPGERMASEMTEEFEVDIDTANEAIRQFLATLIQKGILEREA